MIIRGALKCKTCDQSHTVRVGLGQEDVQTHRFDCRGCGEEIVIRLELAHEKAGVTLICEENAEKTDEIPGAPIVNLDANFLIPADEQGKDMVFPRLAQVHEMAKIAEKMGSLVSLSKVSADQLNTRPYRRPDYAGEWRLLKKAWSLARNGRDKLSKKRVAAASVELYPKDPLTDLADWAWRFSLFSCQPVYELILREAMTALDPLRGTDRLNAFAAIYEVDILERRSTRYFETITEFFSGYSEYAQVYFHVVRGIPIPPDYHTASIDFDRTKMFYGNAFERFASLAELLARLNNMLLGREHDKFEKLTMDEYRRLDKSSRFGPFAMNKAFTAICAEANNQIRNASHHGSFNLHRETQTIRYMTGKGGAGPEQQMSYATYLGGCCRLYLQTLTLFRMELLLCNQLGVRYPL